MKDKFVRFCLAQQVHKRVISFLCRLAGLVMQRVTIATVVQGKFAPGIKLENGIFDRVLAFILDEAIATSETE